MSRASVSDWTKQLAASSGCAGVARRGVRLVWNPEERKALVHHLKGGARAEAGLTASDLTAALVGQMCRDAFGLDPARIDRYAVARGAAIHAQTIPEEEWTAVARDRPVDQT